MNGIQVDPDFASFIDLDVLKPLSLEIKLNLW